MIEVSHVGQEFLQRIMEKLVEAVTEELNRYPVNVNRCSGSKIISYGSGFSNWKSRISDLDQDPGNHPITDPDQDP